MAFGQTTRYTADLVTPSGLTISPAGIVSAEAFGTASISRNVKPVGIASAGAFGAALIELDLLQPTGIPSSEAFGAAKVSRYITPTGIPSSEAFGAGGILGTIHPAGIPSGEVFGATTLPGGAGRPHTIKMQNKGIASALAFGIARVVKAGVTPAGIPSAEAFGTPGVILIPNHLAPSGIPSGEQFGNASLSLGRITPSGIASATAFGTATLFGPGVIAPQGIPSAEAFGLPRVALRLLTLSPLGIPSAEAFGPNDIVTGPSLVLPVGIASAQAFGIASVWLATAAHIQSPRDTLTNPSTLATYEFPINHETEDAVDVSRTEAHGGPNVEASLTRIQSARDGLVLKLMGAIIDPVQYAQLDGFFDACDSSRLVFHHASGDEYEVIITNWEAHRIAGFTRNHRLSFWRYSMELSVLKVRAGAFAELVS